MTNAVNIAQSGSNNQTMRNRIINGAMVIDQRNAGAAINPVPASTQTFPVDRFPIFGTQASKLSAQQNAGGVTPPVGFTNYLGVTSLSSYSVVSSDIFNIYPRIEGYNIADFGWGTANAQSVTISFWARSSLTGTFGISLQNAAQDRAYATTYTINSANTWEYKTITILGDTTGTWNTTNGVGISLNFNLGNGSTYTAPSNNTWVTGQYFGAIGATSVVGTNGATFYITGVQLEEGTAASPFENRLYGTELALCQRYYQIAVYAALAGRANGTSTVAYGLPLAVPLRSSPTVSDGTTGYAYSGGARVNSSGGASSVARYNANSAVIYLNRSGFTVSDDRIYNIVFDSDLTLSAEL
jgi:hypothetical protein